MPLHEGPENCPAWNAEFAECRCSSRMLAEMDDDTEPAPPKVTGAPERIWLVVGDIDSDYKFSELDEVCWSPGGHEWPADIGYVRADIVLRLRRLIVELVAAIDEEHDAMHAVCNVARLSAAAARYEAAMDEARKVAKESKSG